MKPSNLQASTKVLSKYRRNLFDSKLEFTKVKNFSMIHYCDMTPINMYITINI